MSLLKLLYGKLIFRTISLNSFFNLVYSKKIYYLFKFFFKVYLDMNLTKKNY